MGPVTGVDPGSRKGGRFRKQATILRNRGRTDAKMQGWIKAVRHRVDPGSCCRGGF